MNLSITSNLEVLLMIPILIPAALIDLRTQRIPNLLTLPAILLALILHTAVDGTAGLIFSLKGALLGTAILLPPYLMGGMGAGDAKLMGAVGAAVGAGGVFVAFLFTALFGGVYALLLVLVRRKHFQGFWREKWLDLKLLALTRRYAPGHRDLGRPRLCYGAAIAAGSLTYLALSAGGHAFWT